MLGEHGHDLVAFLPAQQAGIDENAGQLLADRTMQQGGDDRGIDAAGEAQDDLVVADLLAHSGDLVVDDVGRRPQRAAAADLGDEAAQQGLALARMGDFGMELHAVPVLVLVGHRGDRNAIGARGDDESRRGGGDMIAMAHPDVQTRRLARMIIETMQQHIAGNHLDFGMTEFARIGGFGRTAELGGQGLHAVADAEDRQSGIENFLRRLRRTMQRGRLRPPGQHDALRTISRDLGRIMIPGPDLAIDTDLANAPRDQLRVLRTEIEDQDLVVVEVGHAMGFGIREWRFAGARNQASGAVLAICETSL